MSELPWHLQSYKKSFSSTGRLIPVVEKHLIQEQLSSTRDTEHLHPSEICKRDWCPRSSWYTIKGYEKQDEKFTFQRLNIFAEGHAIHEKWQTWLKEAGVLEQAEVAIQDEEHLILGHADGIVSDKQGRAVLEIKSVGAGTIRMEAPDMLADGLTPEEIWKKVRKPFATHLRQLMLYMYCTGIHEGVVLYEWKATQEVKEFAVKFQPELIEHILVGCRMVVSALKSGIPPMRPTWMEDSQNKVCKTCPYQKVCWKDDESIEQTITSP